MNVVLIKRDHVYASAYRPSLETVFPGVCFRQYCSAADGMRALEDKSADIALLGVRTEDADGLDYIPEVVERGLAKKIIVLCGRFDVRTLYLLDAMRIHGIINAVTAGPDDLIHCLARIMDGKRYVSPSIEGRLRTIRCSAATWTWLSGREQQVLAGLGAGLYKEKVAELLGVSADTVRSHRSRIMAKLDVHYSGELMNFALVHAFVRHTPFGVLFPGLDRSMGRGIFAEARMSAAGC